MLRHIIDLVEQWLP